jgi:hypothetical protein
MAAKDFFGVIPAARNIFINPGAEANATTGYTALLGVVSISTLAPVEGLRSFLFTKNVTEGVATFSSNVVGNRPAVVPGDVVQVRCRIKGPVGKFARFQHYGLTAAVAQVGVTAETWADNGITFTGGWQDFLSRQYVIPATSTTYGFDIRFDQSGNTTLVNGELVYIDMIDGRINQVPESYVAGDQGDLYSWVGTAQTSQSLRAAADPVGVIARAGGATTVSTRVYTSNVLGATNDELTDYVIDGSIVNDIDRDFAGSCDLVVTDASMFPAYSWVKIYQDVKHEIHGTAHSYPVGLFRLSQPSGEYPSNLAQVYGIDATVQVADFTNAATTLNLAGGTLYTTQVRTLIEAAGLVARHSIPDHAATLPTGGLSYPRGTSYLTIVNELLSAIAYYNLYALPDGTVASQPYIERASVQPAHTWTIGQDSELIGSVSDQVNDDDLYNYVVATRVKADQTVDVRVSENKRADHPYSTVSLGALAGVAKVYRTKRVEFNEAATTVELQKKASETLQLASMLRYVTVEVLPHPDHMPHEVCELQFAGTTADELSGRYYIESSQFGLVGSAGTMTLKARRVEKYD